MKSPHSRECYQHADSAILDARSSHSTVDIASSSCSNRTLFHASNGFSGRRHVDLDQAIDVHSLANVLHQRYRSCQDRLITCSFTPPFIGLHYGGFIEVATY